MTEQGWKRIALASTRPTRWIVGCSAVFCLASLAAAVGLFFAWRSVASPIGPLRTSQLELRPSVDLVMAVRQLSRLETTEVQVEKVIDLSDKQGVFFGLIEAKDALLLIAAGKAIIGVELEAVQPGAVAFDETSKTAQLSLPSPTVLSVSLDERRTYVYTRTTDTLAKRNEQLEARARREAVAAIERTARDPEMLQRAKILSERQLKAFLAQFGVRTLEITWRDEGTAVD